MQIIRCAGPILAPVREVAEFGGRVADRLTGGMAGKLWRLLDNDGSDPQFWDGLFIDSGAPSSMIWKL